MARRWLKVVVLLTIANGFPVIGGKLFDTQFSQPLDRGVVFVDGRPVFGQSKTIRGVYFPPGNRCQRARTSHMGSTNC
jgi:hypothetical protein